MKKIFSFNSQDGKRAGKGKKRRLLTALLLCAALTAAACAFPVSAPAKVSAASFSNYFQYDIYEGGGYYEINYYLDISEFTESQISGKIAGGVNELFDSIERFFYAYEKLMYNNTHARFIRSEVEEHSSSNPYYSFNMYIYFQSGGGMTAGEKYDEYFKYGKGEAEPTKKGFFADIYDIMTRTHFYVPNGLPDYSEFSAGTWTYDSVQPLASLNAVMMPFLLYGNQITLTSPSGNQKIEYDGLIKLFPAYFSDKAISRSGIFSNFTLYHTLSAPTRYIETDADEKEVSGGLYMHAWRIDYSSGGAQREINIIYTELHTINMYFFAVMLTAGFIGLMAVFLFAVPALKKKKQNETL